MDRKAIENDLADGRAQADLALGNWQMGVPDAHVIRKLESAIRYLQSARDGIKATA